MRPFHYETDPYKQSKLFIFEIKLIELNLHNR